MNSVSTLTLTNAELNKKLKNLEEKLEKFENFEEKFEKNKIELENKTKLYETLGTLWDRMTHLI